MKDKLDFSPTWNSPIFKIQVPGHSQRAGSQASRLRENPANLLGIARGPLSYFKFELEKDKNNKKKKVRLKRCLPLKTGPVLNCIVFETWHEWHFFQVLSFKSEVTRRLYWTGLGSSGPQAGLAAAARPNGPARWSAAAPEGCHWLGAARRGRRARPPAADRGTLWRRGGPARRELRIDLPESSSWPTFKGLQRFKFSVTQMPGPQTQSPATTVTTRRLTRPAGLTGLGPVVRAWIGPGLGP